VTDKNVYAQNKTDVTMTAGVSSSNCYSTNTNELHALLPECSADARRRSFRMQAQVIDKNKSATTRAHVIYYKV
jgi:hypothetical protein